MADDLAGLQRATHHAVLEAPAHTAAALRQQIARGDAPPALAALVGKVREHAYRVTDADIDGLRAQYSEDQLFEIVVAAALGAAEHRLARALAVVEEA
jgi:alkylhydroperoxidase family enzyme